MKSMTYAQKADPVAKCKRVFESMTRANHLSSGNAYRVLAAKALFDVPSLANEMHDCWFRCTNKIKSKPRYRYDNKAEEWVKRKSHPHEDDFYKGYINPYRSGNESISMLMQSEAMQNTPSGRNPFHPYVIGPGAIGGFY